VIIRPGKQWNGCIQANTIVTMLNAGAAGPAASGSSAFNDPAASGSSAIQQPVAAVHSMIHMAFFCLRLACIMTIVCQSVLLGKVESRRWRAMSSNPYFTDYYSVQ
jgi:hypothetical protein